VTVYVPEEYTSDEAEILRRYFTNLDGPVFALVNLPEVVKGALFARYSRTTKSLRRLFLDEFAEETAAFAGSAAASTGSARAERLYDNVFVEYGDDSVAQLGGVHLACEQSSQLLAKALEWGRLAAYLEQSTRYMRYDGRPGGAWRATVPTELEGTPDDSQALDRALDRLRHGVGDELICCVFLREHDRIWLLAQRGYDRVRDGYRLDHGVMSRAIRTSRVQFVPDVERDPDYVAATAGIRSEVAAPFGKEKPALGVLNVQTRRKEPPFGSERPLWKPPKKPGRRDRGARSSTPAPRWWEPRALRARRCRRPLCLFRESRHPT